MRKKKRKKRKIAKWGNAKHRIPPMPSWFKLTSWGTCRWCNCSILKEDGSINTRRKWHPNCLHEYLIISDHRYAKRQVKKRDKGICACCKTFCRYRWEWNCDHIKPLIDANGDITYWQLSNLQTLCLKCHKAKSLQENIERGKGWFAYRWGKKKPT